MGMHHACPDLFGADILNLIRYGTGAMRYSLLFCYCCGNVRALGLPAGDYRCNDESCSSGEDGLHHLHRVRLLLEPVHRGAVVRQLGQSAATRSPVRVHASAPARQSQFRNLRPDEPQFTFRFRGARVSLLPSSGGV